MTASQSVGLSMQQEQHPLIEKYEQATEIVSVLTVYLAVVSHSVVAKTEQGEVPATTKCLTPKATPDSKTAQ